MPNDSSNAQTDDPRFAAIRLGDQVRRELRGSEALNLILERLDERSRYAKDDLLDCDPTDARMVAALQERAKISGEINKWLQDAMQASEEAIADIQAESFED
jgi:hypothetical protein